MLPDGTLILFFSELPTVAGGAPPTLRVMRSTDKGVTWSAPITIAELQTVGTVDPETGIGIRDASVIGAIAAGNNGVLAVTWQDSRFAGGAYDGIAFSQSTDGGVTWSAPLRINGDPSVRALIPSVAIRADGIDRRHVLRFPRATRPTRRRCSPTSGSRRRADGETWTERRLAGPFDYAKAPLVGGRYFLGDYMGMTNAGDSFVVAFGRANTDTGNRADIVTSLARPFADDARRSAWSPSLDAGVAPDAAMRARIGEAVRDAVRARRRAP